MNCNFIPVKLVLATIDEDLYGDNGWKFKDTLYWGVKCLAKGQITVSDKILPSITDYKPVKDSPSEPWDFCKDSTCSANTNSLQVVFTFNPTSNNPKDFLQYVISIHGDIPDIPTLHLTDSSGSPVYFQIGKVTQPDANRPFTEIWLLSDEPQEDFLYRKRTTQLNWLLLVIFIILVIMVVLAILFIHS